MYKLPENSFPCHKTSFKGKIYIKWEKINQQIAKSQDQKQKPKWLPALSNEWGRLASSNHSEVLFHNAIKFVAYESILKDRKTTYASFVCDHRPYKDEPWRIRLVVGGDKLDYPWNTQFPTIYITETKVLLNSVISDTCKGTHCNNVS